MDLRITPKATVGLQLNLDPGAQVPIGSFVTASSTGEKFRTSSLAENKGTIAGIILANAEALNSIEVLAGAGDIDTIDNSVNGWNSVTNLDAPSQPGDLDLSTGDLLLTDGAEEVAQNIRIRLRFFQGEWFLDIRVGIPYFKHILVKSPNLDVVRFLFRKAIEDIPKVKTVERLDLTLDGNTRTLSAEIEVKTDLGETLGFEETLIFETLL